MHPPKYFENHLQKHVAFYLGKMKFSASVNERTMTYRFLNFLRFTFDYFKFIRHVDHCFCACSVRPLLLGASLARRTQGAFSKPFSSFC